MISYLLAFFAFAILHGDFIENLIDLPDAHRHIFIATVLQNIIRHFGEIASFLCPGIFLHAEIQSKTLRDRHQSSRRTVHLQFLSIVTVLGDAQDFHQMLAQFALFQPVGDTFSI